MTGSIVRRGRGYAVKVELPPDPGTGKRRQRWRYGFKTKKEAERARNEILASLDQGEYLEPSREKLKSFLDSWLAEAATRVRPSTLASYELIVRRRVVPYLGAMALRDLRPQHLNKLYADLLSHGSSTGGPLSPKSVRNVHIVVHRALQDALRWSLILRNPADLARGPRVERRPLKIWSMKELRQFLDSVADDPLYAAWLTTATTGLRRGEVLGLRWSDLDLARSRASIIQQVTTIHNEPTIVPPKTAKGRRIVAFDERTAAALRQRQEDQRMLLGERWDDNGLVFTRSDGQVIHPDLFSRRFAQRVKAAGLPLIRLHDLRHGWATMALEAGIHPKVVSEQLGHANTGVTLDVYSHVAPSMSADAVERVASALFADPT